VKRRGRGLAGLSLAASAGLLGAYVGYPGLRMAHAATPCTVTNNNDSGAGSLRGCLDEVGTAGGGTITFAEETNGTSITLKADLPLVNVPSSLTITGNGEDSTVIDGQDPDDPDTKHGGLYFDGSGTVTVTGIKIQNTYRSYGGAIDIDSGDLTVTDSSFDSNRAEDDGGAINTSSGATLSVSNSTFTNNRSGNDGGVGSSDGGAINASGDVTISNSTFTGNAAVESDAEGGAIETSSGHVAVTDSTFTSNTAGEYGGAIRTSSGDITVSGSTFMTNSASDDGGVFDTDTGSVTISGSTFTENSSDGDGGIVDTDTGSVTISDSTFTDNSGQDGGVVGTQSGTVTITDSTLTNNSAVESGGVVDTNGGSVTISDSTLTNNSAVETGGVVDTFSGTVAISDSTLTNNSAVESGGVVDNSSGTVAISDSTFTENSSGNDGGVVDTFDGDVTVTRSTFSGNTSGDDGGVIGTRTGAISVTNSTFTNNSATAQGAVIAVEDSGSASLNFVTASDNTTNIDLSGAVDSDGDGTVTNSILFGNTGGDVIARGTLSASHSLFTSTSSVSPSVSGATLIFGEDPLLGALGNNGGPTQTMMPGEGSPVLGAANPSGAPATDQRGYTRTTNGRADMGAVERLGLPPDADPSQVPPSWYQAQGRQQREAVCPPGMAPSWAQWPNERTGGWTCEWTTWWNVNEGVDGGWVTTPGFRAGRLPTS